MTAAHRRHDAVWERLRPHLPGGEGKRAHDNRRFIDAVCWILRKDQTGPKSPKIPDNKKCALSPLKTVAGDYATA